MCVKREICLTDLCPYLGPKGSENRNDKWTTTKRFSFFNL